EIFERNFIHCHFFNEFLGAEAVVEHRASAKVAHLGRHGGALIARCAVIHTVNGAEIAVVLDNHPGAQQGRLQRAHLLLLNSRLVFPAEGFSRGERIAAEALLSRHLKLSANNDYTGPRQGRSNGGWGCMGPMSSASS